MGEGLWIIFVIILPYLGVFVYLIAHGHKMARARAGRRPSAGQRPVSTSRACEHPRRRSTADQLAKLADLKAKGTITDAEYEQAKAKILS